MPEIGTRYQPFADTQLQPGAGGGRSHGVAPQEAIRTLSLRVPQTQSVPGISPLPLLNAGGGGGTDLDMLLAALMKAFSQGGGGARQLGGGPGSGGFQAGPMGGPAAPPRITPGGDGTTWPTPPEPPPPQDGLPHREELPMGPATTPPYTGGGLSDLPLDTTGRTLGTGGGFSGNRRFKDHGIVPLF
jgi:hypothetical protein